MTKDNKTNNQNYWISEKSEAYNKFAFSIPSDLPAHIVGYHLLSIEGKVILDFGCFKGKSSNRILQLGAYRVVGIDKSKENIEAAKKDYSYQSALSFEHVSPSEYIKNEEKFEGAAMMFVHQSISSLDELKMVINKISRVLKKGSSLVLLGHHLNALKPKYKFLFYTIVAPEKIYDGVLFSNKLKALDGTTITLGDYYWTNNTLKKALKENQFSTESILNVDFNLKGELGEVFEKEVKVVERKYNITNWLNEWEAPAYQLIYAKKI